MVTSIKVQVVERSKLGEAVSQSISKFDSMLSSHGCQTVNVTMGPESKVFLGWEQVVTIVWTGNAPMIKSSYNTNVNYGFLGGITVTLY